MEETASLRVGIAGVTGYVGREIARLIAGHDGFRVVTASSDGMAGNRLRALNPDLLEDGEAMVVGHGDTVSAARDMGVDIMFSALPPARSGLLTTQCLEAGIRVIDLSGAHALADPETHRRAYGFEPDSEGRNASAVYGLTEWADPEALAGARLVANAGYHATAVLLAVLPLVDAGIVDLESLVVDAKTGTTSLGRKAQVSLLYSELFANFYAYRVGRHPQAPEITQAIERVAGEPASLTFAAHLLPVTRGLHATCYIRVPGAKDAREAGELVRATLRSCYAAAPFVRVLDRSEDVHLRAVIRTNRCLMSATADPLGGRVILVSAIDNLIKGGAGQAIQNANLMCGFEMTRGLGLSAGGRP